MIVVYECDDEVLITTKDHEEDFLKDYFEDSDRNLCDYYRSERGTFAAIRIKNRLRVKFE